VIDLILTHYGVKGMKWGVRRKRGSGGTVSTDHSESRKLLRRKLKTLSNEDIARVNKRLNLEKDMTRLSPLASGKRGVDKFIAQYGNNVIAGLAGLAAATTLNKIKKAVLHGDISHYGVKGMQWGIRRKRGSGGRVGTKVVTPMHGRRRASLASVEGHSGKNTATVKGLKSQIKAKKAARWEKDQAEMNTKEDAAYAKLDATLKKNLAKIEAGSKSRVDKALGKFFTKQNDAAIRDNVVGKLEDAYIRKEKARKKTTNKAKRAAEHKLDTELSTRWTKMYDAAVKGKSPLEAFKAYAKMDKAFSQMAKERWLALDLEHA